MNRYSLRGGEWVPRGGRLALRVYPDYVWALVANGWTDTGERVEARWGRAGAVLLPPEGWAGGGEDIVVELPPPPTPGRVLELIEAGANKSSLKSGR